MLALEALLPVLILRQATFDSLLSSAWTTLGHFVNQSVQKWRLSYLPSKRSCNSCSIGKMFTEDISALVFDAGSHTIRVGFAGDDAPKIDLPAFVGVGPRPENPPEKGESCGYIPFQHLGENGTYYIGTIPIHFPREDVEMATALHDSMIEDWDMFEGILQFVYDYYIGNSSEFSALFTEPAWNRRDKREQLAELMFEKFGSPAFFLAKSAVLAAYAHGRTSALVVDSGASQTYAVAVLDGYCIPATIARSPLAGDFISTSCLQYLQSANIEVVPKYMIKSKESCDGGKQAVWKKKSDLPKVTQSFHNCMVKEAIDDLKACALQVSDTALETELVEKYPRVHYEFPNGTGVDLGKERFEITETLFDTSFIKPGMLTSPALSISSVISTSINLCDNENRASLYGAVLVTGGNSLLSGFTERLNYEINQRLTSNVKVKLLHAPSTLERRFGAWTGGSILGSLPAFQKMWISKQEYEESGRGIVIKKCPEAFGTCAVHACVIWSRTHLLIRTVASVGAALFGSKPAKRCPLLEKIRFR
uniref:Actin-like protein 6A n=1 Tax=Trichuris muris TaxID=70415 RepID=A0A5S6QEU3_TRIMR